jgi:hypothetical protein
MASEPILIEDHSEDRTRGPPTENAFSPRFQLDRDQKDGCVRMHNAYRSGAERAGHVKVEHYAKIRTQAAADESDRSAKVKAN